MGTDSVSTVENLYRGSGEPDIYSLLDVLKGNRIVHALHGNVVIWSHRCHFPDGQFSQYEGRDDTDSTLNSSFILGSADSGRQNCRAIMLCQLLVRFIENNLILPMLLHAGFQIVALDDPCNAAKVFVGIHMGSGP